MNIRYLNGILRTLFALVSLWIVCGCKTETEQKGTPGAPGQSPAVEGMRWLKEHGYVDQNGRPIEQERKK